MTFTRQDLLSEKLLTASNLIREALSLVDDLSRGAELRVLSMAESTIQSAIRTAVELARSEYVPWSTIGMGLSTSAQAAQQRYGKV